MTVEHRIGVIGGTFDPVHGGHVAAARGAQQALGLDRLVIVPSREPPHRAERPRAGGYHRFAMVALATVLEPAWTVSDTEFRRSGPSFTYETLTEIGHEGYTPSQIFFIIGTDAFAEIATWSRYPAVLDLAHFAVVARPGTTIEALRARLPDLAARMTTPAQFAVTPPVPGGLLAKTRVILMEMDTPDVSATDIRRRARTGQSLSGMVPDSVEAYIAKQRLYRTGPEISHFVVGR